jgi:hypothetical protein
MSTRKNITIKNWIDGLETTQKLSVIDIFPSVDKTIEELMKQIQTMHFYFNSIRAYGGQRILAQYGI